MFLRSGMKKVYIQVSVKLLNETRLRDNKLNGIVNSLSYEIFPIFYKYVFVPLQPKLYSFPPILNSYGR